MKAIFRSVFAFLLGRPTFPMGVLHFIWGVCTCPLFQLCHRGWVPSFPMLAARISPQGFFLSLWPPACPCCARSAFPAQRNSAQPALQRRREGRRCQPGLARRESVSLGGHQRSSSSNSKTQSQEGRGGRQARQGEGEPAREETTAGGGRRQKKGRKGGLAALLSEGEGLALAASWEVYHLALGCAGDQAEKSSAALSLLLLGGVARGGGADLFWGEPPLPSSFRHGEPNRALDCNRTWLTTFTWP